MNKITNVKNIKTENSLDEEIIQKLKIAEEEIKRGDGIDIDIVFKEMRQKYGY